jgi:hypothetical protein
MAQIEITVPSFVKGEPGFAAKLNELGVALTQLAAAFNEQAKELEALRVAAPKATATRKAPTKAE